MKAGLTQPLCECIMHSKHEIRIFSCKTPYSFAKVRNAARERERERKRVYCRWNKRKTKHKRSIKIAIIPSENRSLDRWQIDAAFVHSLHSVHTRRQLFVFIAHHTFIAYALANGKNHTELQMCSNNEERHTHRKNNKNRNQGGERSQTIQKVIKPTMWFSFYCVGICVGNIEQTAAAAGIDWINCAQKRPDDYMA